MRPRRAGPARPGAQVRSVKAPLGAKGTRPQAPVRALGSGRDTPAGAAGGALPSAWAAKHPSPTRDTGGAHKGSAVTGRTPATTNSGPRSGCGRAGGKEAGAEAADAGLARPGSPGGAAPGRPPRRPRVPRGPSCCTRSRPPPPWPHRIRRGEGLGSAPRARRPGTRPRAAGLGQPRPRGPADAHAGGRSENGRGRRARGAGVNEAWPGPGRSSCPTPAGRGLPGERPGATRPDRHWTSAEPHARPGEVRGPGLPIPGAFRQPDPLRPGAAPAVAALGPTQPRGPRASRPQGGAPRALLPHGAPASATSRALWDGSRSQARSLRQENECALPSGAAPRRWLGTARCLWKGGDSPLRPPLTRGASGQPGRRPQGAVPGSGLELQLSEGLENSWCL